MNKKICDQLFEEICDEVIKCDDKAPSVPDVILQVISEILSENNQTPMVVLKPATTESLERNNQKNPIEHITNTIKDHKNIMPISKKNISSIENFNDSISKSFHYILAI
jgi:hypothetical protein